MAVPEFNYEKTTRKLLDKAIGEHYEIKRELGQKTLKLRELNNEVNAYEIILSAGRAK